MYPPPGLPPQQQGPGEQATSFSVPPLVSSIPAAPVSGHGLPTPPAMLYGAAPPGPPPPGPVPFLPPAPHLYQQPYSPGYQAGSQSFFQPGPPPGPSAEAGAGGAFGIPMNPLSLMAAGNIFGGGQHWGQQYMQKMQQRVGSFTGGAMNFHFAISGQYVTSKLLMLLAPYLKRWTYTRQPEQMQGASAYKPPRVDVNCPDLYIPLMALWAYVLLVAVTQATQAKFKPDNMYGLVWTGGMAWAAHVLVARIILRAMNLPASVPWVELLAYTGYMFVPVCITIVVGQLAGRWAYYGCWVYGSLCAAVFMVRTMKRVIFQEARGYGRDLTLTNYLLLALASFQFPYAFYLGVRP